MDDTNTTDRPTATVTQPSEMAAVRRVALEEPALVRTEIQALWAAIRRSSEALGFSEYTTFLDRIFDGKTREGEGHEKAKLLAERRRVRPLFGVHAYELLRKATEAFVFTQGGTAPKRSTDGDDDTGYDEYVSATDDLLPYIRRVARRVRRDQGDPFSDRNFADRILDPTLIELIWSYWHEQGMLVQTTNALALRFQNRRALSGRDPLANFAVHPIRPLANVFWGYIQAEHDRLSVARRAYEYEEEYGLPLSGRAVANVRPAESRTKFLEAFHRLLSAAAVFYDKASNLTVRPDGFPLLNSLRELHLVLAEGANNQFRDLTWTARVEMLMQQWILARPEVHDFLSSRVMVPYAEEWMPIVDSMKRLMEWDDVSVTHFHDLARCGEKILLSVRYGDWSAVNDEQEARGWAHEWKPEIQRYVHSYEAVTGVDLGASGTERHAGRQVNAIPPAVLLEQRLARTR